MDAAQFAPRRMFVLEDGAALGCFCQVRAGEYVKGDEGDGDGDGDGVGGGRNFRSCMEAEWRFWSSLTASAFLSLETWSLRSRVKGEDGPRFSITVEELLRQG